MASGQKVFEINKMWVILDKGQKWPWSQIHVYLHLLIYLPYTPIFVSWSAVVSKISTIYAFSIQKHTGINFELCVKGQRSTWSHHLNKHGSTWVPNAAYQVSVTLAIRFWRRRFLKGFTIYGHGVLRLRCAKTVLRHDKGLINGCINNSLFLDLNHCCH